MISSAAILSAAATSYGLKVSELLGSSMLRPYVRARLLVLALFREFRPEIPGARIAHVLQKDTSTVNRAIRNLDVMLRHDAVLARRFEDARLALKSGADVPEPSEDPRGDRRRHVRRVSPVPQPKPGESSEDFYGRVALKNSEDRLLLALRRAHPELECAAFAPQRIA